MLEKIILRKLKSKYKKMYIYKRKSSGVGVSNKCTRYKAKYRKIDIIVKLSASQNVSEVKRFLGPLISTKDLYQNLPILITHSQS